MTDDEAFGELVATRQLMSVESAPTVVNEHRATIAQVPARARNHFSIWIKGTRTWASCATPSSNCGNR
jgi:hypothetical protein